MNGKGDRPARVSTTGRVESVGVNSSGSAQGSPPQRAALATLHNTVPSLKVARGEENSYKAIARTRITALFLVLVIFTVISVFLFWVYHISR